MANRCFIKNTYFDIYDESDVINERIYQIYERNKIYLILLPTTRYDWINWRSILRFQKARRFIIQAHTKH